MSATVVIAAYYLLPWIPLSGLWRGNVLQGSIFLRDWQVFATLGNAVAALAALVVAALVRQQRRALPDA